MDTQDSDQKPQTAADDNREASTSRRYRGMTSDEYQQERRARLYGTALALFTEQGYGQTPISQVCAEAGVSTRHFYELYRDREALVCDVFDQLTAQCAAAISTSLTTEFDDPFDSIAQAIRAFLDFVLNDKRRAHFLCVQIVGISEKVESHRRQTIRQLANLVAKQANALSQHGALPQRDYRLPALMLTGAVNELIVEHLTSDQPMSIDEITREMNLFFRAMLIGAQAYTPRP